MSIHFKKIFPHEEYRLTLQLMGKILKYERLKVGLTNNQVTEIVRLDQTQEKTKVKKNQHHDFPSDDMLNVIIRAFNIKDWNERYNPFWDKEQLEAHIIAEEIRENPDFGYHLINDGHTDKFELQKSFGINIDELSDIELKERDVDKEIVSMMKSFVPTHEERLLALELRALIFKNERLRKGLAIEQMVQYIGRYDKETVDSSVTLFTIEEYEKFEEGKKFLRHNYLVSGLRVLEIHNWNERFDPFWEKERLENQVELERSNGTFL